MKYLLIAVISMACSFGSEPTAAKNDERAKISVEPQPNGVVVDAAPNSLGRVKPVNISARVFLDNGQFDNDIDSYTYTFSVKFYAPFITGLNVNDYVTLTPGAGNTAVLRQKQFGPAVQVFVTVKRGGVTLNSFSVPIPLTRFN